MDTTSTWLTLRTIGPETSMNQVQRHSTSFSDLAGQKRRHDIFMEEKAVGAAPRQDWLHETLPKNHLRASQIIDTGVGPRHKPPTSPILETNSTTLSQDPLLSLAHPTYQLPFQLVSNLASLGVTRIYEWQRRCLTQRGLLQGRDNLVYVAPTGGGKSLVADVLLLKRIIENPRKKAILVLPFVALVQEKLKWYRKLIDGVGKNVEDPVDIPEPSWRQPHTSSIRVAGFFGGSRVNVKLADVDIAICTIEKANALVNFAIEDGTIDQLGAVVIDELHMIDDEHRGYLIELMVTKLLCLSGDTSHIQLIGMSATLPNIHTIANWMQAKFYVSKHRPVPIQEYLVYDSEIFPTADSKEFFRTASQLNSPSSTPKPPEPLRRVQRSSYKELENPMINAVVALAVETATAGYGALVFCNSRYGSQNMAKLISKAMPMDGLSDADIDSRLELVAALQSLPAGFDPDLSEIMVNGVAFHNAGLTTEEREIITEAYDKGIIKVIVATASLAAGCNLPARRVILNGARMGRELVGPAMLRQMRGRAGRKGKDEVGESFVCCEKEDLEAVAELLEAELPPISSCLTPEKRGMTRALLEVIATRLASTRWSLEEYVQKSLLFQTMNKSSVILMLDSTMESLLSTNLVQLTSAGSYEATRLGQAIVASSLGPADGIFVHQEFERALKSFVMDGELHIFYLFTPVQTASPVPISWNVFRDQMSSLDESGMRTLRSIGISPPLVNRLAQGEVMKEDTTEEVNRARIYRRVFSAFQLRDLCNEIPIHEISLRYQVPRGFVQTLSQTCLGFASGMIKFCQRMDWGMLAAVLEHMVDRLRAGARGDLLEMAQVNFVKSRMARIFFDNGYKSVRALADAQPKDLVPIMMQVQARNLRLRGEAAEKLTQKLLAKAEVIVSSASRLFERQQIIDLE